MNVIIKNAEMHIKENTKTSNMIKRIEIRENDISVAQKIKKNITEKSLKHNVSIDENGNVIKMRSKETLLLSKPERSVCHILSENNEHINAIIAKEIKTVLQKNLSCTAKNQKFNRNAKGNVKTVPKGAGKCTKRKKEKGECDDDLKQNKSAKRFSGDDKSRNSCRKETTDISSLDFHNESQSPDGSLWNLKISSWNVNGIRAWLEKNGLSYLHYEKPDILCVQETKCSDDKLPEGIKKVDGYHTYWLSGDKDGYSGVGLLSKIKPLSLKYGIGIPEHDNEGRVITAEYDKFYLVAAYVPNAGRGLVRLDYRIKWDEDFRMYLKELDSKKAVVLCGDLNVAHEEIDLANPKTNKKNAGFTKEEREGFSTLLQEGFIDTFRHLYPTVKDAYTFWTYMMNARAKNVGWRLDYFVLSKRFTENLCDSVIRKDVYGSDHCPIALFLAV